MPHHTPLSVHPNLHGTPLFDIWGEKGLMALAWPSLTWKVALSEDFKDW
jgi:hypothetical protein